MKSREDLRCALFGRLLSRQGFKTGKVRGRGVAEVAIARTWEFYHHHHRRLWKGARQDTGGTWDAVD